MGTRSRVVSAVVGGTTAATAALCVAAGVRFVRGQRRAGDLIATTRYPKFENAGSVERLSIVPLVEWHRESSDLTGEAGVSYLIRADKTTILFDLGANEKHEEPSPLIRNAKALDVDLKSIDAVVLSHAHVDHTGGGWRRIDPQAELLALAGRTAYVPSDVTSPTLATEVVLEPRVIAPGVALMGPIPRQDFILGWTLEQSLAVNVRGRGLVLISGCGHPTVQQIVARAKMLFDEPIYGVVGGLHLPVTASRMCRLGVFNQRLIGTGKWPWDPISYSDVEDTIAFFHTLEPGLVAVSPHDSCDWTLDAFRNAFPGSFQDLRAGKEILVTGLTSVEMPPVPHPIEGVSGNA